MVLDNAELTLDAQFTNATDQEMHDDDQSKLTVQEVYNCVYALNFDLPCSAARHTKILSGGNLTYVVCTFGDGRVLTINIDQQKASKLATLED